MNIVSHKRDISQFSPDSVQRLNMLGIYSMNSDLEPLSKLLDANIVFPLVFGERTVKAKSLSILNC